MIDRHGIALPARADRRPRGAAIRELGLILIAVALGGCTGTTPAQTSFSASATPPASAARLASPVSPGATAAATTPATVDPVPELEWTSVPVQASMKNAQMTAVAVGPGRYVAVGCRALDSPSPNGAAWTSVDGETWTSGFVKNDGYACLDGVISSSDGYLAWGFDYDDKGRAAFWHSDDGNEWVRAPSIKSFTNQRVVQVVHVGDRFVAFSQHEGHQTEPKARIWVSPDGERWSDQPDSTGCDGGRTSDPGRLSAIKSVLVDGTDIVAIGATFTEWLKPTASPIADTGGNLRVLGRSHDALCWTVTYTPTLGVPIESVLTAGGIVGVGGGSPAGSVAAEAITAWTSDDDSTWTPSTFDPEATEGALELLATGDCGLLAMGLVDNGEPTEDPGDNEPPENLPPPGTELSAWWSADGRAWTRIAAPDATTTLFADMTAIPGGFLVVGRGTDPSGEATAQVWIAR